MIFSTRVILLLSSLALLANCTTISLTIPGATIESSESAGKGKKELGPSLEPAREIEYTDTVSSRPPNLDQANAGGATHTLLHQARFGLPSNFEIGGELGVDTTSSGDLQTAIMLVGKYQFLGPTKDKAKKGDATASLFGRLGWVSADGSGDQNTTFGPGGFPWTATVDAYFSMAGMSFGYRVADPFLIYFAGSYQHITSKIEVDQSPATDNSDPGGRFTRDRDGHSVAYGMGAQLRVGKVFYFHGKLMMFSFELDGIDKEESLYGAGGFHFYF